MLNISEEDTFETYYKFSNNKIIRAISSKNNGMFEYNYYNLKYIVAALMFRYLFVLDTHQKQDKAFAVLGTYA